MSQKVVCGGPTNHGTGGRRADRRPLWNDVPVTRAPLTDRPLVHYTATGWLNDPHGIVYRDGRYHVFFQSIPDSLTWRVGCAWGHASGPSLFELETHALALAPGDGDDGVWTGCVVLDGDTARAYYTAVSGEDRDQGRIREAVSVDPDLVVWEKRDVVIEPPVDPAQVAFRDPVIRWVDGHWLMTVGAALTDGRAVALAWSSPTLDDWRAEGIVAERAASERDPWTGTLWECPQFVDVDGVTVLITSVWADDVSYNTAYAVGRWVEGRYVADSWGELSSGTVHYAPSVFHDADGRPCVLFWLRGVDDEGAGWAGAHSVPYLIGVEDGRVRLRPHPDLDRFRAPAVNGPTVVGPAVEEGSFVVTTTLRDKDILGVMDETPERLVMVEAGHGQVGVWIGSDFHLVRADGGEVQVIFDRGIVEVVTPAGLVGGQVAPRPVRVAGNGDFVVEPLRRD